MRWLKERRQKRNLELYNRGYDFACGSLLRGDKTPLSLEALIPDFNKNHFDLGMEEVIDKLISLGVVVDDRV